MICLLPAPVAMNGVQGSLGLWAVQPGCLPVHSPDLSINQVESIQILLVLGAVEHLCYYHQGPLVKGFQPLVDLCI